jgi:hypothetical protein
LTTAINKTSRDQFKRLLEALLLLMDDLVFIVKDIAIFSMAIKVVNVIMAIIKA